MWPFIVENLSEIIRELQDFAEKKYNEEEAQCSQRVVRLTLNNYIKPGSQTNANTQPRAFTEIIDEEYVYIRLNKILFQSDNLYNMYVIIYFFRIHMWFVWILSVGASHFVETLPLSLLGEDVNFNVKNFFGM